MGSYAGLGKHVLEEMREGSGELIKKTDKCKPEVMHSTVKHKMREGGGDWHKAMGRRKGGGGFPEPKRLCTNNSPNFSFGNFIFSNHEI